MAELGNVFGTSIFRSETLYTIAMSELFIRSGVKSNEQTCVTVSRR